MILELNDNIRTTIILTPRTDILLVTNENDSDIQIYQGGTRIYDLYYAKLDKRNRDLQRIDNYLTFDRTNPEHSAYFI